MCAKWIHFFNIIIKHSGAIFSPFILIAILFFSLLLQPVIAGDITDSVSPIGFFDKYNGFDISNHSIPKDKILSGGPPKDGIPSINNPKFVSVKEAHFMNDNDLVIGARVNDVIKAYPIKILNWHEIVNDTLGKKPVVVSFCPLCGTGLVFEQMINNKKYTFGVSGLLYQSDLLMYDHQTESLWSQIEGTAVTGEMLGKKLTPLPVVHMTWKAWKEENPETLVLSTDTGFQRDYDRDPYQGYELSERLYFPVEKLDGRFHPKEKIVGVEVNGVYKAYPFSILSKEKSPVEDEINGKKFKIFYEAQSKKVFVTDENEKVVPSLVAFWFAWYAFHQETLVYEP